MHRRLPRAGVGFLALIALTASLLTSANAASAASDLPQGGPAELPLSTVTDVDGQVVLGANRAARSSDFTMGAPGWPFDLYMSGWTRADQHFTWTVTQPAARTYRVQSLMAAPQGQQFQLTVRSGDASGPVLSTTPVTTTMAEGRWDRRLIGDVALPAGTSSITLTRTGSLSGTASLKALEMFPSSEYSAYQADVAAARADTSAFTGTPYGLFFQYGPWGGPRSGTKKSMEQQTNDFDVPAFVEKVKATGAGYVIWSISWWTYQMSAPISSVDAILGHGDRTTQRDLIGEVASALKADNIGFHLYYHTGQDWHLGANSTDWWQKQQFPSTYPTRGWGDRATFIANWKTVIEEIGTRYGSDLDGWFFDDGNAYYGYSYLDLKQSARAGNPERMVSFNGGWNSAQITNTDDIFFGEIASNGSPWPGISAPNGSDGKIIAGPGVGEADHLMSITESNWGITGSGQQIITSAETAPQLRDRIATMNARRMPFSMNVMMWENGAWGNATQNRFEDLAALVHGGLGQLRIADTDQFITYGAGWSRNGGLARPFGNYNSDVSYATANGAEFSYTFEGTGIEIVSERHPTYGDMDVYIDGTLVQTVSAYAAGARQVKQVVFSKRDLASGTHTIRVVKRSGQYLVLDALQVLRPTVVNNHSPAIAYAGSGWSTSINRDFGNHNNDVAYTTVDNSSATFTFTGSRIGFVTEKEPSYGLIDVYIDGQFQTTVDARATSRLAMQEVFATAVTPGSHTIKLVKKSGSFMLVDGFRVTPSGTEEVSPNVEVTVDERCIAGKAYVTARVHNLEAVPVDVAITTEFGQKQFTAVAADKNVVHAFNTRATTLDPGDLTVATATDLGAGPVTGEVTVEHADLTC